MRIFIPWGESCTSLAGTLHPPSLKRQTGFSEGEIVFLGTIKTKDEAFDIEKKRADTFEKLNKQQLDDSTRKNKYIEHVEAKLGDVKDLIIRTFPEKLEDFNKWYNFPSCPIPK